MNKQQIWVCPGLVMSKPLFFLIHYYKKFQIIKLTLFLLYWLCVYSIVYKVIWVQINNSVFKQNNKIFIKYNKIYVCICLLITTFLTNE